MKKVYEKPRIYMERFELAEHIAGCSFSQDKNGIWSGTIDGLGPVSGIFGANEGCSVSFEDYCYTNGARPTYPSTINS